MSRNGTFLRTSTKRLCNALCTVTQRNAYKFEAMRETSPWSLVNCIRHHDFNSTSLQKNYSFVLAQVLWHFQFLITKWNSTKVITSIMMTFPVFESMETLSASHNGNETKWLLLYKYKRYMVVRFWPSTHMFINYTDRACNWEKAAVAITVTCSIYTSHHGTSK